MQLSRCHCSLAYVCNLSCGIAWPVRILRNHNPIHYLSLPTLLLYILFPQYLSSSTAAVAVPAIADNLVFSILTRLLRVAFQVTLILAPFFPSILLFSFAPNPFILVVSFHFLRHNNITRRSNQARLSTYDHRHPVSNSILVASHMHCYHGLRSQSCHDQSFSDR